MKGNPRGFSPRGKTRENNFFSGGSATAVQSLSRCSSGRTPRSEPPRGEIRIGRTRTPRAVLPGRAVRQHEIRAAYSKWPPRL